MSEHSGIFITLEGIEGSGKSSLLQSLRDWLRASNRAITVTREPGGTSLGKSIRQLLLQQSEEKVATLAELLLFSADRAQHIAHVLSPALSRGEVVLCDRYIHSTLAYQGSARGIPEATLRSLIELSTNNLLPDLVLLLDLPPEEGLARASKRKGLDGDSWSRFEEEAIAFHTAVRNGFLQLAKEDQKRFALIDASASLEKVLENAKKAIEPLLKR